MNLTPRKTVIAGLATLAVGAVALSGCAPAPTTSTAPSGPAVANFLPCMVSDAGGFNDHSFNELGLDGLQAAAKDLGVKEAHVQSNSNDEFAPNIDSLIQQGCNLIITVGFNLSAATVTAANANPNVKFAIVDDQLDNDFDGKNDVTGGNGKPILFNSAEAAFLGGYAAASYSKTGVVGTFGGMQIPSVAIFMDGFAEGVAYYNQVKGTSVKVVGWDVASQKGTFTGGFEAGTAAKKSAQSLLDQNADVLFPVGGPIYQSAAEAIRDKGGDIALIGVDADVYLTDPTVDDLLLTSVQKGVDSAVKQVVEDTAQGKFDATPFVGTLANGSLNLAPFHDFASKVNPSLQGEIDQLKADIISGKVPVTSVNSPK